MSYSYDPYPPSSNSLHYQPLTSYPMSNSNSSRSSHSSQSSAGSPRSSHFNQQNGGPSYLNHSSPNQSRSVQWDYGMPREESAQLERIQMTIADNSSGSKRSKANHQSNHEKEQNVFHCLETGCGYNTGRQYDLKRHVNGHSKKDTFPCRYRWCKRDKEPFTRRDHLDVHYRTVHMKDIPKKGKGGRRKSGSPESSDASSSGD